MKRSHAAALQEEALDLIIAAHSGRVTVGELQALTRWREQSKSHAEAYSAALRVWEALGVAAAESVAPDYPWAADAGAKRSMGISRRSLFAGATATAAVGVFALHPPFGLWPSVRDLAADYHTSTGEQRTVALGDGTTIAMNTATRISRRKDGGGGLSFEVLRGEAMFRNANVDESLSVQVLNGIVTAGLSMFNLRHDGSNVVVTCLQGTVAVDCAGEHKVLLRDQQLMYSRSGIGDVAPMDGEVVTAWRRGRLVFKNETFARVLDEVRRYWRGEIFLLDGQLGQRRVTLRVELARIDEVVGYAQAVLGATVHRLPGGIIVIS